MSKEVAGIVDLISQFRGMIEGGVCVRRQESFVDGSEQRYFVFQGRSYASDGGAVPAIVDLCVKRIASPFFSVDVALRTDGNLRLVVLGDGQVSGRKEWLPERFVEIFA